MKRIAFKINKFINKNQTKPITRSERCILRIALKIMKNKDTELLIHPSKDRYYIHSEDDGVFMIISRYPQNVTIVNHKFSYDVKFSQRAMDILTNNFIETTERRRDAFENTFLKNTENSLETIYKSLK